VPGAAETNKWKIYNGAVQRSFARRRNSAFVQVQKRKHCKLLTTRWVQSDADIYNVKTFPYPFWLKIKASNSPPGACAPGHDQAAADMPG
jgi:hypothetical protein